MTPTPFSLDDTLRRLWLAGCSAQAAYDRGSSDLNAADYRKTVEQEIRAAFQAMSEDAARLDWLEVEDAPKIRTGGEDDWEVQTGFTMSGPTWTGGKSLREALDAARRSSPPRDKSNG